MRGVLIRVIPCFSFSSTIFCNREEIKVSTVVGRCIQKYTEKVLRAVLSGGTKRDEAGKKQPVTI